VKVLALATAAGCAGRLLATVLVQSGALNILVISEADSLHGMSDRVPRPTRPNNEQAALCPLFEEVGGMLAF